MCVGNGALLLWRSGEFNPFSRVVGIRFSTAEHLIFGGGHQWQLGVGNIHTCGADHQWTVDVVFLDICEIARLIVVAIAVFPFSERIFVGGFSYTKSGMSICTNCKHISAWSCQFGWKLKRVPLIVDVGNILSAEQHSGSGITIGVEVKHEDVYSFVLLQVFVGKP